MADIDTLILDTIRSNNGRATTRELIDGFKGTRYESKQKPRLIEHLRAMERFGMIVIHVDLESNTKGRKPFYYTLPEE